MPEWLRVLDIGCLFVRNLLVWIWLLQSLVPKCEGPFGFAQGRLGGTVISVETGAIWLRRWTRALAQARPCSTPNPPIAGLAPAAPAPPERAQRGADHRLLGLRRRRRPVRTADRRAGLRLSIPRPAASGRGPACRPRAWHLRARAMPRRCATAHDGRWRRSHSTPQSRSVSDAAIAAAAANAAETPGTTSNATPASAQRAHLLGRTAKQQRVAALEPDHAAAGLRVLHHQRVDLFLGDGLCAAALAHVDDLCVRGPSRELPEEPDRRAESRRRYSISRRAFTVSRSGSPGPAPTR